MVRVSRRSTHIRMRWFLIHEPLVVVCAGNNSGAISSHPEVKRAPKKKKKTMVQMEETILR